MWATTRALRATIKTPTLRTALLSSAAAAAEKPPLVLVEKINNYAIVRMNRPPVNSLNTELLLALGKTIKDLEADKSMRGMILASSNQRVFSAGLDILEMYQTQPDRLKKFWTALQNLYLHLYMSRLATVAAIEGHSPAGGCLLAISCDYRIMTAGKPVIGLNETQLGIVAPLWFRDTFVNTIGQREAEKMLGLGIQVDASKAKAIGLVDEAVPLEEVMPRSVAAMERWLAIPDGARVHTKRIMRQDTANRLSSSLEQDYETFHDVTQTDKTQKALGRYLDSLKKK